jgi:hypothetical protein
LHTGFTTNTSIIVKINNTISSCVQCRGWANFYAGRVSAVVASVYRKLPGIIWEFPFFNIFHMSTVDTNRHIMLTFASYGAGMTANAHSIIYYKSVIHFILLAIEIEEFIYFSSVILGVLCG